MTLKTNPLICFPEYDRLRGENGCQVSKKEVTVKGEMQQSNANPFLAVPEYEPETCSVSINERRNSLNKRNVNQERVAMKYPLKRERSQKPNQGSKLSIKEMKFKNFSRDSFKNEKKKKLAKTCKQQDVNIDRVIETWGVPKPVSKTCKQQDVNIDRVIETWGVPKPVSHTSNMMITDQPNSFSLEAAGGFDWNATAKDLARVVSDVVENDSETEDSDQETPIKRKKLTTTEKRKRALEKEKTMKKKEKELLEAEENPQSPDHFERLLIGSPNSSELWIKYMGYHAINADIEKARIVARRGIKRIDPQLTSSKLDVWIALLNLEHTFSPLDTFKETFSEALKFNDDYAVNSRVLSLYTDSKNVTEVDQLTNIMTKKYRNNLKNWLQCQNALMTVGLIDKARNLLQKALSVLTKKEHVTLISRFALLENKHGLPEQAQALFENLLTSFPQRVDLLSVYVDMLIKSELINLARSVLERAASNSLPVRKMRSIYMKWIAFEEAHGKPSNVASVEEAAKKYVTNILRPKNVDMKEEKDFESSNSCIKLENTESLDDGSDEESGGSVG